MLVVFLTSWLGSWPCAGANKPLTKHKVEREEGHVSDNAATIRARIGCDSICCGIPVDRAWGSLWAHVSWPAAGGTKVSLWPHAGSLGQLASYRARMAPGSSVAMLWSHVESGLLPVALGGTPGTHTHRRAVCGSCQSVRWCQLRDCKSWK